jgi:hypothetical protein
MFLQQMEDQGTNAMLLLHGTRRESLHHQCGGGGAHLGGAEVLDYDDLVAYSSEGTG